MPAATAFLDPLDRDHLARLVGRASELRRALGVVAERIATRRSDASRVPQTSPYQETPSPVDPADGVAGATWGRSVGVRPHAGGVSDP